MRLLLDECVPRPLKRELLGHEVSTVGEQGCSGKRNSELLKLVLAERFEGFLILDALGRVRKGHVVRVGA